MVLGLRWAFFKSKIKALVVPSAARQEAQYADLAQASLQHALAVGRGLVTKQRAALEAARDTLGLTVHDVPIVSIEVQFLWGVYYELVADGPTLPTNGYDRIVLHIISYLMDEKRASLEQAREIALGVQGLFNEEDRLFDIIQQGGRRAYREGDDQVFIDVVRALNRAIEELGEDPDKLLPIPSAR